MAAPGEEHGNYGPVGRAISTSVLGNSTAFGFSITVTVSLGALQSLLGSPALAQLLVYGMAAAVAVAVLEGAITRGFRAQAERVPAEVSMLGTAQDFLSVAAAVGAVIGVGSLLGGTAAWAVGGYVAATVFIFMESAELLLAQLVQKWRGDPRAEASETED